MNSQSFHNPVLTKEVTNYLQVTEGEKYIDATLGGGGHAKLILQKGGTVLGIDQDQQALSFVKNHLNHPKLTLAQGNFSQLKTLASENNFDQIDGIIFDLGVSSHQLDTADRGFSFQHQANLDMRMSADLTVTAKDLINALSPKELAKLFLTLGGETKAKAIAKRIVALRESKPITTTSDLKLLIEEIYPNHQGKIHPATKAFQALRIAVNDELNSLKSALPQALELLKPGGRLVVISFHQGEDKIVKEFLKTQNQNNSLSILTPKPIRPTEEEISSNPRSRSARLRAAQKN